MDGTLAATVKLQDVLNPMISALVTIVNLLVVISSGFILRKGKQPRTTYMFLGNVAVTDLVMGATALFDEIYSRRHHNDTFCNIQIGLIVAAAISSGYSVALIAFDRFLYILYGLQYQRWITVNRARLLNLLTWIVGLMTDRGWRRDTNTGGRCLSLIVAPPTLIMVMAIMAMVPMVVVIVLYSIILHHAMRKVIQLRNARSHNSPGGVGAGNLRMHVGNGTVIPARELQVNAASGTCSSDLRQESMRNMKRIIFRLFPRSSTKYCLSHQPEQPHVIPYTIQPRPVAAAPASPTTKSLSRWKAIKVVFFTTGCFIITWVPSFIGAVLHAQCDPVKTPQRCNNIKIALGGPLALLAFANSLLNPLIYAWWHNGFRASTKAIFCGGCTKCWPESEQQSSTLTTTPRGSSDSNLRHLEGSSRRDNLSITGDSTGTEVCLNVINVERRV